MAHLVSDEAGELDVRTSRAAPGGKPLTVSARGKPELAGSACGRLSFNASYECDTGACSPKFA